MRLAADSLAGRVLAVVSRRSPGFQSPMASSRRVEDREPIVVPASSPSKTPDASAGPPPDSDRAAAPSNAVADQRQPSLGRRLLASIRGTRARSPKEPEASAQNEAAAKARHTAPQNRPGPRPQAPSPPPRARQQEPRRRSYGGYGNRVRPHLLSEDRQEYEQVLDEALHSAPNRPELATVGQRLNAEQLRTMALNASALITAAAATEYQHYVKVREELRQPAPSAHRWGYAGEPDTEAAGRAATLGEAAETDGAGALAVIAVLAPVLAGTAAVLFLLVGFLLKLLSPEPAIARTVITAGWVSGAVAGASVLAAAVGLLLTAMHKRPSHGSVPYGELPADVAGPGKPGIKHSWNAASCRSCGRPSPTLVPRRHCTAPHRGHRPAICRTSATTVPASAALTTPPARARTSPARTSQGRLQAPRPQDPNHPTEKNWLAS
jgi:hypothetical protein